MATEWKDLSPEQKAGGIGGCGCLVVMVTLFVFTCGGVAMLSQEGEAKRAKLLEQRQAVGCTASIEEIASAYARELQPWPDGSGGTVIVDTRLWPATGYKTRVVLAGHWSVCYFDGYLTELRDSFSNEKLASFEIHIGYRPG